MRACVKCGNDIEIAGKNAPGLCTPYGTCCDAETAARMAAPPPVATAPPKDVPNCRDRTCSGAVYERSQASLRAMQLADARTECAHLERRMVEMRDEAALEIEWLKRELRRNDPRLYKARYERRSLPTGSKAE